MNSVGRPHQRWLAWPYQSNSTWIIPPESARAKKGPPCASEVHQVVESPLRCEEARTRHLLLPDHALNCAIRRQSPDISLPMYPHSSPHPNTRNTPFLQQLSH